MRECRLQPAPALLCALACHLGQFDRVGGVERTQAMSQRAAVVLWLREPAVKARSRVRAWRWRRTPPALSLSRLDIAAAAAPWLWAPAVTAQSESGLGNGSEGDSEGALGVVILIVFDMSCELERPL